MDKSAIQEIRDLALAAAQEENIGAADTLLAALPSNFGLHSLERYMAQRARFRGEFVTRLIDHFHEYYMEHRDQHTRVFVDDAEMAAEAVFNLGTRDAPGHCDHVARLVLRKTPEYQALLNLAKGTHSQQTLAAWFEDWRDHITPHGQDGEAIDLRQAIGAIRSIEVDALRRSEHTVADMRAEKSTLEQIEARSRLSLPAGFRFRCRPYEELEHREFQAVLRLAAADEPRLSVRIVAHQVMERDMAEEFVRLLNKIIEPGNIYIGCFSSNQE